MNNKFKEETFFLFIILNDLISTMTKTIHSDKAVKILKRIKIVKLRW